MGDSYDKVKESERVEAIRERARIVVDAETRFPKSHKYHRFMHFIEAAGSTGMAKDTAWEGVTRRVGQMMRTEMDRLDEELVQMKSEMNSRFKQLDGKLDTLLEGLK